MDIEEPFSAGKGGEEGKRRTLQVEVDTGAVIAYAV